MIVASPPEPVPLIDGCQKTSRAPAPYADSFRGAWSKPIFLLISFIHMIAVSGAISMPGPSSVAGSVLVVSASRIST